MTATRMSIVNDGILIGRYSTSCSSSQRPISDERSIAQPELYPAYSHRDELLYCWPVFRPCIWREFLRLVCQGLSKTVAVGYTAQGTFSHMENTRAVPRA